MVASRQQTKMWFEIVCIGHYAAVSFRIIFIFCEIIPLIAFLYFLVASTTSKLLVNLYFLSKMVLTDFPRLKERKHWSRFEQFAFSELLISDNIMNAFKLVKTLKHRPLQNLSAFLSSVTAYFIRLALTWSSDTFIPQMDVLLQNLSHLAETCRLVSWEHPTMGVPLGIFSAKIDELLGTPHALVLLHQKEV